MFLYPCTEAISAMEDTDNSRRLQEIGVQCAKILTMAGVENNREHLVLLAHHAISLLPTGEGEQSDATGDGAPKTKKAKVKV